MVRHLCEQGHSVINIDRKNPPGSPARFVYMDIRRRELLQPVLEQVECVIHLGEIPHMGVLPNDETFQHNTAAASTVLQTAADLKLKHVVYTSSCQVYGAWGYPMVPPVRLPVDEDHPLQPQNAYALSKAANESYCRFIARDAGLRVSIFRLPWVLSRGFDERMIRWMDRGGSSSPDGFSTYIHANDVAVAYEAALLRNLEGCRAYHLMACDTIIGRPVRELLEQAGVTVELPVDWPVNKPPVTTEKARQELGWEPQFSVWAERERRGSDVPSA